MVKFKEQIKCPSHEQNLEKQTRSMRMSIGVQRPNMSKAATPLPCVPFPPKLYFSSYNSVSEESSRVSPSVWQNQQHIQNCSLQGDEIKFPEEFPLFRRNPKWDRNSSMECVVQSGHVQFHSRVLLDQHNQRNIFFQKLLLMTMSL